MTGMRRNPGASLRADPIAPRRTMARCGAAGDRSTADRQAGLWTAAQRRRAAPRKEPLPSRASLRSGCGLLLTHFTMRHEAAITACHGRRRLGPERRGAQLHHEGRASAQLAAHADAAAHGPERAAADGKAEPGHLAPLFGREVWVEDARH